MMYYINNIIVQLAQDRYAGDAEDGGVIILLALLVIVAVIFGVVFNDKE